MPALKETGTEHLIKHVKKMIPKKTSQMENDSGYITGISKEDVTDALGYTPPTTNTTYGVATSSALGLVKSGTDITVDSSGNVSVNDDSHNHVISNVDGLQSALDGKAASSHTHSSYVNQNAFSNVVVGSTTVSADSKTDTLTLVAGSNVTITPDATNDKITISSSHESIATSTDTTSTVSPSAGDTFTAVDSVTRDGNGHVTKVNTKTVTLPNTAVTVDSALSSTSTNPVQNKVVYDALNGKSDTGHTHTKSEVGLGNVDNTADTDKSVKYAESAGSANSAVSVVDYGDSSKTIKIGFAGAGATTSNLGYIAGYINNGAQIKDVSKDTLKSWLGLGNAAYTNSTEYAQASHSHDYLPLSGGTISGSLNVGGKVGFSTSSEGGNIYWRSPEGVEWEFDCFNENFRLFNYSSFKNFVITRDKGDVYLPNNLYLSASAPLLRLNDFYINRNGNSTAETHIYGNTASYPHIMLRQYTNAFQFFPNTTYVANTQQVHIGHSEYRFGDGYFTNLYNSSGIITTSDRNKKNSIKDLDGEFVIKIIEGLAPKSFKFNDGTSGRTHFGIIAQDLEELLESLGISNMDFAPLVKEYPDKEVEIENTDYDEDDENSQKYIKKLEKDYDGEPTYNVRYEEFIMLIVKYCQELKSEIEEMKLNLGGN